MQFIMLTDKLLKMRNSFKINKFYKNPCHKTEQCVDNYFFCELSAKANRVVFFSCQYTEFMVFAITAKHKLTNKTKSNSDTEGYIP